MTEGAHYQMDITRGTKLVTLLSLTIRVYIKDRPPACIFPIVSHRCKMWIGTTKKLEYYRE